MAYGKKAQTYKGKSNASKGNNSQSGDTAASIEPWGDTTGWTTQESDLGVTNANGDSQTQSGNTHVSVSQWGNSTTAEWGGAGADRGASDDNGWGQTQSGNTSAPASAWQYRDSTGSRWSAGGQGQGESNANGQNASTSASASASASAWGNDGPNWVVSQPDEPQQAPDAAKLARTLAAREAPLPSNEEIVREDMDEIFKDWPWEGVPEKLITLGPWIVNYHHTYPFALNRIAQSSPLFTVLGEGPIRDKIMGYVLRDHFDAASFGLSCREALGALISQIGFWDLSSGWFNQCQYPRYGPGSSDDPNLQGSVPRVLVVTPVRHPVNALTAETAGRQHLYEKQMTHFVTMNRSLSNFGDFIKTLHLHRVPFLTIDVLKLVIPNMRKLVDLGVYKCQLIHIGDAIPLLDIIKLDRPADKEDQVYLDFFPNYHVGPKVFPGYTYQTGSYGVTWDNWNGDTRLAIWALVRRIIPKALSQGIDMTKPGTAFRGWLDRSPCWRIEETLKDLMDPNIDPIKLAVSVDFPNYKGNVDRFTSKLPNRPEGWKWAVESYTCRSCHTLLPGFFYSYTRVRRAQQLGVLNAARPSIKCLGCSLANGLNDEPDHLKAKKRNIIRNWLEDDYYVMNTNEHQRALTDFDEKGIMQYVKELDDLRHSYLHYGPARDRYDPEYNERQREFTPAELGRLGLKNQAPVIQDEQQWLDLQKMSPEERQWSSINTDRLWGHGH